MAQENGISRRALLGGAAAGAASAALPRAATAGTRRSTRGREVCADVVVVGAGSPD